MPSNQTHFFCFNQHASSQPLLEKSHRVQFGPLICNHVSCSKRHCEAMSRVRGHTQPFPCRGSPHRRCPAPYLLVQNLPVMPFRQSADPELIVLGNFAEKKHSAKVLKEKKYPPRWDFPFSKLGYVNFKEDKVFEVLVCFSTHTAIV